MKVEETLDSSSPFFRSYRIRMGLKFYLIRFQRAYTELDSPSFSRLTIFTKQKQIKS